MIAARMEEEEEVFFVVVVVVAVAPERAAMIALKEEEMVHEQNYWEYQNHFFGSLKTLIVEDSLLLTFWLHQYPDAIHDSQSKEEREQIQEK